jgi:CelD/BcsL family acetyltransferase involved in cellulose biosynthesis
VRREVRWIEDGAGLEAITAQWDGLAGLDATPFSLSDWYAAWWGGYREGRDLRICTVWEGDELMGLLPLCRARDRLESMANVESCVFRPLARDDDALAQLADAALAEKYGVLELTRLPVGDPGIPALDGAARAAGRLRLLEPDITSPIVDTRGTLEDYRHTTRSKWHKNLWRLYRKLVREHDAELHLIEPPADLHAELEQGLRVEASGWKSHAGSAVLSRPRTHDFYLRLAERFHARGELRMSSIAIGGRMVAWDFGILHRNRLYSPKSGYLEEFKALAPGLVLELATIERCFEAGIDAHELLGSDEPYKLRFATSERRHRVFRAFPQRPGGMLRYAWRRYAPHDWRERYAARQSSTKMSP